MILHSKRLKLREACDMDIDILATYQADARYLAHYAVPPDAAAIVAAAQTWAAAIPRQNYQLIVTLAPSGTVIGCAGLRRQTCPAGSAELGFELDPAYWGMGYASEAASRLLQYGREDLGLTAFISKTSSTNKAAQRLLETLGFTQRDTVGKQLVYDL